MTRPAPDDPGFAAWLDQVRRSLDLHLDAEGRWWHEGAPFEHPKLIALFDQGLDTHPDSHEPILRVGDTWCYVKVADTAFFVRRLRPEGAALRATLNNGEVWSVPADGLSAVGDFVYAQLAPHRRAKLTRDCQNQLSAWIIEVDGDAVVAVGGRRWALPWQPA